MLRLQCAFKYVINCPNGNSTSFKELVDRLQGQSGGATLLRIIKKPLVIVPLPPGTWISDKGLKVPLNFNVSSVHLLKGKLFLTAAQMQNHSRLKGCRAKWLKLCFILAEELLGRRWKRSRTFHCGKMLEDMNVSLSHFLFECCH